MGKHYDARQPGQQKYTPALDLAFARSIEDTMDQHAEQKASDSVAKKNTFWRRDARPSPDQEMLFEYGRLNEIEERPAKRRKEDEQVEPTSRRNYVQRMRQEADPCKEKTGGVGGRR